MVPKKRDRSKEYPKKTDKKPSKFGFPNELLNRTLTARYNIAWQIDATYLPITLNNEPGTSHTLLVGVDTFSNKLLFTKVIYSGKKKSHFTSNHIIKTLKYTIQERKISDDLIIHFDRGGQFSSKIFHDFLTNEPFLIGSQTCGGAPDQNAVIERMINTFKNQLKYLKLDLPQNVKRTRDLQTFCDKKRITMNAKAPYDKNRGLTPNEFEKLVETTKVVEPDIVLANNTTRFPDDGARDSILKYREDLRFGSPSFPQPSQQALDDIQIGVTVN